MKAEGHPLSERDQLIAEREAGLDLYRAIQGGLEECPFCNAGGLRHELYCPVTEFMRALRIGPFTPRTATHG